MEQSIPFLSHYQKEIIAGIQSQLSDKSLICAAYLFGSFLRSDTWHDIDVALFLNQDLTPYERYKFLNRIGQEIEQVIHPRTHVDVRILNNAPITLTFEVISTGLLLISNDDTKTVEFEADILIRYLDMQSWFNALDYQYLEALAG